MPDDRFLHRKAGHSQKVNLLTDLEYRVWTQYLLSADDFGVMRGTHHPIQNDNDHLANRPSRAIQRCLDALVTCGLIRRFEHQGKPYVYQHDWQDWQKVSYPRGTNQPCPSSDALADCSESTQELFQLHPGGAGRKRRERSENVSETFTEDSSLTRARAPAKRLMANGERLTAKANGELAIDECARELLTIAPEEARIGWDKVERPLYHALHSIASEGGLSLREAWEWLKARLEQHKRSHRWRVKGMVNRLDRWLIDGVYLAEYPEEAPASERMSRTTSITAHGAAEIMKETA